MKRTKPLQRTSRLRRVSKKQAGKLREYSKLRKQFLAEHPRCEARIPESFGLRCVTKASDVHHMARRGVNLLKVSTWLATCRWCHRWIEENGREARKLGYLK